MHFLIWINVIFEQIGGGPVRVEEFERLFHEEPCVKNLDVAIVLELAEKMNPNPELHDLHGLEFEESDEQGEGGGSVVLCRVAIRNFSIS